MLRVLTSRSRTALVLEESDDSHGTILNGPHLWNAKTYGKQSVACSTHVFLVSNANKCNSGPGNESRIRRHAKARRVRLGLDQYGPADSEFRPCIVDGRQDRLRSARAEPGRATRRAKEEEIGGLFVDCLVSTTLVSQQ